MTINCLALDDEPLALELLESFIKKVPYLNLIGMFENPGEALSVINEKSIDLLYLDINMPDINGLQLVRSLQAPPSVIFTTAYENFALQGFELNAMDYLLKPFSFERFLKATERAQRQLISDQHIVKPINTHEHIFVKTEHNIVKILLDDIYYIEGYKDYLKIHTNEKRPILTLKSMKSMELLVSDHGFVRIHRSYIISIDKIHSLRNSKVNIYDKWLPISDNYRSTFQEKVLEGRI